MADAIVPGRSARAGRVLGGARGARRRYVLRCDVSVRMYHLRGGRTRHHGGRAPAVVAPVVQGGVITVRAAAAVEQRDEPGFATPWSLDNRTHHLFSRARADPYDASRGVFLSHFGRLLLCERSRVLQASRRFMNAADYRALVGPQAVQPDVVSACA